MNTPSTTHVGLSTRAMWIKAVSFIAMALALALFAESVFAWEIDLSRRQRKVRKDEATKGTTQEKTATDLFLDLFNQTEAKQDLVILNTEKGFVPPRVNLRKGNKYRVHVVNVNEKERNISFILDAFSEHHATYYGKIESFDVKPQKEGVFPFQCPETSAEGKFVVYGAPPERGVSSEEEEK